MINRENLIKIGRAGGNTSNRETPDQIGRVGMSGSGENKKEKEKQEKRRAHYKKKIEGNLFKKY